MTKKYVVSIDAGLKPGDQQNLKKAIEALNVNIVSRFDGLGVLAVEVGDDATVDKLKRIPGITGVEDDAPMSTQ